MTSCAIGCNPFRPHHPLLLSFAFHHITQLIRQLCPQCLLCCHQPLPTPSVSPVHCAPSLTAFFLQLLFMAFPTTSPAGEHSQSPQSPSLDLRPCPLPTATPIPYSARSPTTVRAPLLHKWVLTFFGVHPALLFNVTASPSPDPVESALASPAGDESTLIAFFHSNRTYRQRARIHVPRNSAALRVVR
ncbi:hypothetical protein BC826DRAFT_1083739 [Russula brevipes]|nr:hypothetical protein BC826DRAFT_1083739 [Russula brevipes]